MNVLAFDTSMGSVSVAFSHQTADGQQAVVDLVEARQGGHAERLMPMIAEVLAQAQCTFAQVQRVAVTLGPGTFTGVRTGIAAARAFRLASGVDVVGATSLAVIAHRVFASLAAVDCGRPLMVATDARRGGLYVQCFTGPDHAASRWPEELTIEAALGLCRGGDMRVAGSGCRLLGEAATRDGGPAIELLQFEGDPMARDLAGMAINARPMQDVAPNYVRPPDAKPQTGKSLARSA